MWRESLSDIKYDIMYTAVVTKRNNKKQRENAALANVQNVQTTLRLPAPLYRRAKGFIDKSGSRSVNDFIVRALTAYLRAMERRAIDESFSPMNSDEAFQREALDVSAQFEASDAEAWHIAERDLTGA